MAAVIATRDLRKTYGDAVALEGLSIDIAEGEVFGLLGHNGAGKTTTVRMLTTLLDPSSGTASIADCDIHKDPAGVRQRIGYLPENVQFYDELTMMENLRFFAQLSGLRHPDQRIHEVLEFLNFPGYEKQRLGTFSKGMRQRVGIAQATLHSPAVVFLDEPTSGLDPEGIRILRETIGTLNTELGMTVLMNTHLLSEVALTCTSIGILRAGRLVYHDTLHATLAAFPGEGALEAAYFGTDEGDPRGPADR